MSDLLPKNFDRSKIMERFEAKMRNIVDRPTSEVTTKLTKACRKVITSKEPSNRVVTSHVWYENQKLHGPFKPVEGDTCICCRKRIQRITSVYGRTIVDMIKKVVEGIKTIIDPVTNGSTIVPSRSVIVYPVHATGYACRPCFDSLYANKYTDKEGNIKHGFELLEPPVLRIKEQLASGQLKSVPANSRAHRNRRDEDKPRGKEVVKYVADIYLDHGVPTDEEWASSLPKVEPEPVDPGSYNYFRKGRS